MTALDLQPDFLHAKRFLFYAEYDGHISAAAMRFMPGGAIIGAGHPNESQWRLDNGALLIFDAAGQLTWRFDEALPTGELRSRFQGEPDSWIVHRLREVPADGVTARDCFLGFFGVVRDLAATAPNIERNIFTPLREAGFRCTGAAHFNVPEMLHSPRSNEHHVPVRLAGLDSLNLEICWREPQTQDNIAEHAELLRHTPFHNDPDEDFSARRNALHQLHSLRRLWQIGQLLWTKPYSLYCFLRSDLLYLDPLPVADIVAALDRQADIVTPRWHCWGGLNDRFAFCTAMAVEAYLGRQHLVAEQCRRNGWFHPERLLQSAIEEAGLRNAFTLMRAARVRGTGEVIDEDFSI